MVATEERTETEIRHPSEHAEVVEAKVKVLEAHTAVEEAKGRLARLQGILRDSRDGIERAEARLDIAEAERDVITCQRDLDVSRRAHAAAHEKAVKQAKTLHRARIGEKTKRFLEFYWPAYAAHEEMRLAWNDANAHGVRLDPIFCSLFLPADSRKPSGISDFYRAAAQAGYLG